MVYILGLYAASWLSPVYTAAVAHYGVAIPTGVVLVTSFNLVARPLNALVFAAFISESPGFFTSNYHLSCDVIRITEISFANLALP